MTLVGHPPAPQPEVGVPFDSVGSEGVEVIFVLRGPTHHNAHWLAAEEVLNEALAQGKFLDQALPWSGPGSDGLVFIFRMPR